MKKSLAQTYMEQSVAAATLRTYNIRIDAIKKFLRTMKKASLNLELFAIFLQKLETRNGQASKSTAEGYRAALCHHQKIYGLWCDPTPWADTWQCRKMVMGYAYKGKTVQQTRPVRGQVDSPMFHAMMTVARQQYPKFATALELAYRVALRPHQLLSLHQGAYDNTSITIPDKRCRANNRFPPLTRKTIIDPHAHQLLRDLENKPGLYFDFSASELRRVFQSIGRELQWNTAALKFDGPHCLRHGGMSHGRELLTGAEEQAIQHTLQVSKNTLNRYTTPNSRRKQ